MSAFFQRPEQHLVDQPPIQAEHITVRYNKHRALDDVSFSIPRASRVAVVGPNGAGKTTLFQVIAGVRKPDLGNLRVFGRTPGEHVCIAYVPQRSQADWAFPVNVTDVVMMGRVRQVGLFHWPRREDWKFVENAMERVRVDDLRKRQIGELSGGQQQRVFLAQALAQGAEIVLLDEPLSGLDLPSQDTIFDILEGLREDGVTVLVATHDLNLAAEQFDLVLLLNRKVIALGPPLEVFTQEALLQAYGAHVHLIPGQEGLLLITDTCCDGEEEPTHE